MKCLQEYRWRFLRDITHHIHSSFQPCDTSFNVHIGPFRQLGVDVGGNQRHELKMQIFHLLDDVRVRFFALPWSWNFKHTWMLLLSDTLQTWRLLRSGCVLRSSVERINLVLLEFFINEFLSVLQFKLVIDNTDVN